MYNKPRVDLKQNTITVIEFKPTNALCSQRHIATSKHLTWKLELQRRNGGFDYVTDFKLTCFTAALKAPRMPAAPPQSLFIPSMEVYQKENKTVVFGKIGSLRDGPLVMGGAGGEGNFRAAGSFFRYQIPCMNIFQG